MRNNSVLIITLLFSLNSIAQNYSKNWKDVNYAGDNMEYHRLDIYLPKAEKSTYPVVVAIYGSAWFGNNMKTSAYTTLGKALLDAGFAVVTPNHRASTDAKYPAQIHDIKAVIRFIRANANLYQFDTSFIGITGFSSGGHLAALAGTSRGVKEYTIDSVTMNIEGNIGPYTAYSSSVDAVVDWFGPTDLLKMDSCKTSSTIDHHSASAPEAVLIGGPVQDNKAKATLANPITYVDANDPPFLIIHGHQDPLVSYCQSEILFRALQNVKVPSQFIIVPGGQHGPGVLEDKYFKMMTDFFLQQIGSTQVNNFNKNNKVNFNAFSNYANASNPAITIIFSIPKKSLVSLAVFDSSGREVSKLLSETLNPGNYSYQWNTEKLLAGTYFFRLVADSFAETKKIVLSR